MSGLGSQTPRRMPTDVHASGLEPNGAAVAIALPTRAKPRIERLVIAETVFEVRVSPATYEHLERLAREQGLNVSAYAAVLASRHVHRIEMGDAAQHNERIES